MSDVTPLIEPNPWLKIYDRVKSQVPGASDALIRQEIARCMVDFTQDTNTFQETVDLNVQPNVLSYPFTLANGGTPFRLMIVYKDGDPFMNWADYYISMRVPGTIVLVRAPAQPQLWHAIIAKQTTTDPGDTGYPVVDNWIVDTYNDVIFYGTMWFLQRMPAKPFSNSQSAASNEAHYASQKALARSQNLRQNVFDGQNWMYPQSFRTITRKGWA